MQITIPIIGSDISGVGLGDKLRFTFSANSISAFDAIQETDQSVDLQIPFSNQYQLRVSRVQKDTVNRKLILTTQVIEGSGTLVNQNLPNIARPEIIPVVAIGIALVTLVGLTLAYFTLDKVEKIVDNPAIDVAIIVALIIVVFFMVRYLKG